MKFILGQKIGMTQVFDEKGNVVPVTLITAGPCVVTQVKTEERDGYDAVQVGFARRKGKEFRYLKEYKAQGLKTGDKIDVSVFKEDDKVKISGVSKGKGFQGVVKRWGFAGRGSSHGVKHERRTPGSVGTSFPERVIKGRKMAGRMGNIRITVKNLKIVKVDRTNNIITVKGAVPGRRGTLLEISG